MAKELAVQGKLLDFSLKEDITSAEAMQAVDKVCAEFFRAETSVEAYRLLLGKLLANVQERELFRPQYGSFEQFTMALAEKHRLSRTSLRNALLVAKTLPTLSIKEAESIPSVSLTLIARAASAPSADSRQIKRLIAEAQGKTIVDFRESIMSRGLVGRPGRPMESVRKNVTIKILNVSRSDAGKWSVLVGDRSPSAVFHEMLAGAIASGQKAA